MILRLFRAALRQGAAPEMLRRLREETLPELQSLHGLQAFASGFRYDGERTEHLALSTWTDLAAIEARAGSLEGSVVSTRYDDIFDETSVDHYELVDPADASVVALDGPVIGVVRARVAPNADASALDAVRASRPEVTAAGVMALHVGRRIAGHQTELVILAVWRDRASLRQFASGRAGTLIRPAFLDQLTDWSFETWDCRSGERLLVSPAGPAILVADDTGRYVDASPGVEGLLGVPGELLLGRTVAELTAPGSRDTVARAWSTFLATGSQTGVHEIATPDGRIVAVRFRAAAGFPAPGLHASVLARLDEPEDPRTLEELFAVAFPGMAAITPPAVGISAGAALPSIAG